MFVYNAPLYITLKDLVECFVLKNYNKDIENTPYVFIVPDEISRNLCKEFLKNLKAENNIIVFSISDTKALLEYFKKYDHNKKYLKNIVSLVEATIINHTKRTSIITKLIPNKYYNLSLTDLFNLADNLASLLDILSAEKINLEEIHKLNLNNFYNEIIIKLLPIVNEHWHRIIKEINNYNILDFKAEVFNLLSNIINEHPNIRIVTFGIENYSKYIINFLKAVANHPKGSVIINGLDFNINQNDWNSLLPTHPQYINAKILKKLNIDRKNIINITNSSLENKENHLNINLTTEHSISISLNELLNRVFDVIPYKFNLNNISKNTKNTALDNSVNTINTANYINNISYIELNNESEEANIITQLVKKILYANPDQEILIVTTNYELSQKLHFLLTQENISHYNEFANKITRTPEYIFFKLITTIDIHNINFVNLLALLKHKLCIYSQNPRLIQLIDLYIAREVRPNKTLDECLNILNELCEQKKVTEQEHIDIQNILLSLKELYGAFNSLNKDSLIFNQTLRINIDLAESLSIKDSNNITLLWRNIYGSNLKDLLQQIEKDTEALPTMSLPNYNSLLTSLLNESYKPIYLNNKVSVKICSRILKSRFTNKYIIFLADLNEGSFPLYNNKQSPFVNHVLKTLSLPAYEDSIGIQAFIFMQLCYAKHLYLTRSLKNQEALTTPSRFIIKLENTLKANNLKFNNKEVDIIINNIKKDSQTNINKSLAFNDCKNKNLPSVNPEIKYRPKEIRVTSIETLLKNPYIFFIQNILNLNILQPINIDFNTQLRGILFHKILDAFFKYIQQKPSTNNSTNLETIILQIAQRIFAPYLNNYPKSKLAYYIFKYLAPYIVKKIHIINQEYPIFSSEVKRVLKIKIDNETILLSGRADYIATSENKILIIDFKTGSSDTYKPKDIATFRKQLIVLGYMELNQNSTNNNKFINLAYCFIPNNFYNKVEISFFTQLLKETELNEYIYNDFVNIEAILKDFLLTKYEFIYKPNTALQIEYKHFSRIDSFK